MKVLADEFIASAAGAESAKTIGFAKKPKMIGGNLMAHRIKPQPTEIQPRRGRPEKIADYLAFLHMLPCCVTGIRPVEAAHVSFANPMFGSWGRGKGTKVSDRWALPLSPAEHRHQHSMNESSYWLQVGIDPHALAVTLWGIWSEFKDTTEAVERCEARIRQGIAIAAANRAKRSMP